VNKEVASAQGRAQTGPKPLACAAVFLPTSVIWSHSFERQQQRQICMSDVSMLISRAFRPATSLFQRHVVRYSSMARDYNAAVAALNTLQSNFSIVDAIRKSGKGMNQNAIPEMIDWVKKTGYEV
jgi:hypothetical protein